MKRFFLVLLSLATTQLSASFIDHLRPLYDTQGPHRLRNIDFIYMINLDERPEKFAHSYNQLLPYGIIPYRFPAVNGWELSQEELQDIGIKYESWMRKGLMGTCFLPEHYGQPHHEEMHVVGRTYFCHNMTLGALGINLSHFSILKHAYDSGYETIWVMEDDIEVIKDPNILSDLIDRLDAVIGKYEWDILFTDFDTKNTEGQYVPCTSAALRPNFSPLDPNKFHHFIDISQDFRIVGARYGAYSMIIRRSGMKKLLDFVRDGIFLPFDMEYTLPNGMKMITVRDDIVSTQPRALSDNATPTYSVDTFGKVTFRENDFVLAQYVKNCAFDYMDQLEGWCSKNKASTLIDLVFMLRPKKIVEIGVFGGKSLIPMAFAQKALGIGKTYGIDPWDSAASVQGMDGVNYTWWQQLDHSKILSDLKDKIGSFGLDQQVRLIKATSEKAPTISNIDILHIDGNHSEEASMLDVHKWVPHVRKGGIIIFDDITWGTNAKAVQWLDQHCLKLSEFHENCDWAIWLKP